MKRHSAISISIISIPMLAALGGCGGLSDVGEQDSTGPRAVVTVLGQPFTPAADGSATATVRAQTEIALTAKDSVEGSAPITQFSFEQTDSNPKLPIVIRTVNTVAFTLPAVPEDTEYKFTLSVADSNGGTSTADATFKVKAILDPNQFLQYLSSPSSYQIVVVPSTAVNADPSAAPGSLGDFKVVVRRLLSYNPRSGGARRTDIPLDSEVGAEPGPTTPPPPVQIEGVWSNQTGASNDCNNATADRIFNPDIPSIDQDDINLITQSDDRNQELELSDIDSASLTLDISAEPISPGGPAPQICVLRQDSTQVAGPAASVAVNITELNGPADTTHDTAESTTAYYHAIDPSTAKDTFFKWLRANGFSPTAENFGADAHAVYTNNFDLGLGRDMYMKLGDCDAPGTVDLGTCDVASVVVNYLSLENAAKKLNPINAVAMEYRGNGSAGSPRIVKFYAYAPDFASATGDFKRISSVNLDGRGEKFLPGACTACHGGTPAENGQYTDGDVNAAFLPWDLDALLFGNTDPSFSPNGEDSQLRSTLTRASQEDELRKLNAGAYLTYHDATPGRHVLARELLEGWYQAPSLPQSTLADVFSGKHKGNFVPEGWRVGRNGNPDDSADDVEDDSKDVYRLVFAQNCRMCHIMQVPDPAIGDVRDRCDKADDADVGADQQVPMGCYWQFVNASSLDSVLSEGLMPRARVTMDRFWTLPRANGKTAGAFLIRHLARPDTLDATVTAPRITATIDLTPTQTPITIGTDVGLGVDNALDPINRNALKTVRWSVKLCADAQDLSTCTVDVPVAGDRSVSAMVRVAASGTHLVELRANDWPDPIDTETFVAQ